MLGLACNTVEIRGCKTAGDVYAYYYAGGVLGQIGTDQRAHLSYVTIADCTANGRMHSEDAGGILGWFSYGTLKLSGCVFGENGTVTAESGLGGLMYNAGINSDDSLSISNCHTRGTLSVPANQGIHTSNSSGGFFGTLSATTTITESAMDCTMDYIGNDGNTSNPNTRRVGGIVGYTQYIGTDTMKSIFTGNVTVKEGFMSGDISEANHIGTYCGRPWLNSL